MARSRAVSLWMPVVAWAALIFALSTVPGLSRGRSTWAPALRQGAPLTGDAVLGALLLRALGREAPAFLAALAYAATDELHQHFVRGRHAAPLDVAIDALGITLGLLAWTRVRP